jgi:hypothetical protein
MEKKVFGVHYIENKMFFLCCVTIYCYLYTLKIFPDYGYTA